MIHAEGSKIAARKGPGTLQRRMYEYKDQIAKIKRPRKGIKTTFGWRLLTT